MTAGFDSDLKSATRRVNPATKSRWWVFHFALTAYIPGIFIALWVSPYLPESIADMILFGFVMIAFVSVFGSLIGYHAEARIMKENNSDWVPGKWLYTIGHFLITPFVAAPIYLIDRWLAIGLDWSHLKLWEMVV